ncbi:hypothetical protein NDU88_004218 [Pleurodeles waltl]|uniref:Uncharacterized protein n=1 Tax=Pleurodeles waltl TaxID=8319 RepID=A0AAV7QET8_PLEWA|nr:hypothetical protein NDU88_004218 [Pleurodeles waltl]
MPSREGHSLCAVAGHQIARLSLAATSGSEGTPGAPPGITQKERTERTRKSGFPLKQKTDLRGGPRLKRRTRQKRRDGYAHQQRTTEDQVTAKEKNITTKDKEAPRH